MINHQSGYEERRSSPYYEGRLPFASILRGSSSVFDETTYADLPEFSITLDDRREKLRAQALQTASQLGANAQDLIATDLLSPEIIAALPADVEPPYGKGLIKALGGACRTIGESQAVHRGFYALGPKVSRTIMRLFYATPSQVPQIFRDSGEQTWPARDDAYLDYVAGSPDISGMWQRLAGAGQASQDAQESQKNQLIPRDAIDALAFRHAALTGRIVDPVYYAHKVYDHTPRLASPQECYGMLRNMLAGFWGSSGNDHMFLYANDYSRPNSVAGAKGDFSVCRPGNYIYNDLEILQHHAQKAVAAGDTWIADMPFELVLDYAVANFFHGLQLDFGRLIQREGTSQTSFNGRAVSGYFQSQEVGFPLRPVDRVIPQRQLKKDDGEQRLYGPQDYLNELADIALKLDEIMAISGRDQYLRYSRLDYLVDCAQIKQPQAAQYIQMVGKVAQSEDLKPLTIAYTLYDQQLSW